MSKLGFDPQQLPIEKVSQGIALPSERLTVDWIRGRFENPPLWTPEIRRERKVVDRNIWVPAAVLVPLVVRPTGLSLLLTQRPMHLHDHPGQISFPGGRVDDTDASLIDTALREMKEETGIDKRHIDVLGTMPEYRTGSGFRVTPVVSALHPPFEVKTNPQEVDEAFEVPFAYFMNGQHYQTRSAQFPNGMMRTFYTIPYENRFVWGATAGMLRNLYRFLSV